MRFATGGTVYCLGNAMGAPRPCVATWFPLVLIRVHSWLN